MGPRALAGLVLLASLAAFVPIYPELPSNEIDPSWMLALNQALAQGLVFGRDIVFTFGPYATLYTQAYHPATYTLALLGGALLGLAFAALLLLAVQRGRRRWLLGFAVFLLLIDSRDTLFFSYPLLLVLVSYRASLPASAPGHLAPDTTAKRLALFYGVALLGLLPLVKGSFIPLAVAALLAGLWLLRPRAGATAVPGAALAFATLPLATLLLAWVGAGQPLAALPDFFSALGPVISGYTDAMATYPDGRHWPLLRFALPASLLAFLAVSAWCLLATWRSGRSQPRETQCLLACLGLFLFVAFKAGFVRQDQHALAAGSALLLAVLLLCLTDVARPGAAVLGVALATWLLTHYIYLPNSLEGSPIRSLWLARSGERMGTALQQAFEQRLQALRSAHPVARLQGRSDIYPYDLAALIASDNAWTPRPVLQSYAVYTPDLAGRNEAHLRGPQAPDHIVLRTAAIDQHFPSLEDGLSWPTLLSHYTLVQQDPHYLYLRRQAQPAALQRRPLLQGRYATGSMVELPASDGLLFAELDLSPSAWGRLANLLFKTSLLEISVELQDGQRRRFRLVPGMARSGFILSPLVQSNADFAQLASGQWQALQGAAVQRLRIRPVEGSAFWQSHYTLRLTELRASAPPATPLPHGGQALQTSLQTHQQAPQQTPQQKAQRR